MQQEIRGLKAHSVVMRSIIKGRSQSVDMRCLTCNYFYFNIFISTKIIILSLYFAYYFHFILITNLLIKLSVFCRFLCCSLNLYRHWFFFLMRKETCLHTLFVLFTRLLFFLMFRKIVSFWNLPFSVFLKSRSQNYSLHLLNVLTAVC